MGALLQYRPHRGDDIIWHEEPRVKKIFIYVQSFVVMGLILSGIGGVSYHLFRDNGWVETVFGNLWTVSFQYPLIVIPVIIAAVFLGRLWNESRLAHGRTSKIPDLIIYGLMAGGVFFLGRFFIYGTF